LSSTDTMVGQRLHDDPLPKGWKLAEMQFLKSDTRLHGHGNSSPDRYTVMIVSFGSLKQGIKMFLVHPSKMADSKAIALLFLVLITYLSPIPFVQVLYNSYTPEAGSFNLLSVVKYCETIVASGQPRHFPFIPAL
jgi:hypothetical protein